MRTNKSNSSQRKTRKNEFGWIGCALCGHNTIPHHFKLKRKHRNRTKKKTNERITLNEHRWINHANCHFNVVHSNSCRTAMMSVREFCLPKVVMNPQRRNYNFQYAIMLMACKLYFTCFPLHTSIARWLWFSVIFTSRVSFSVFDACVMGPARWPRLRYAPNFNISLSLSLSPFFINIS